MIFQKLKLSQFIRTRPLKFPSRPSHPKKFLSRPVIYFQNPIPSRWYLIPSRPDKNLLTGSRPVPTQCSGMNDIIDITVLIINIEPAVLCMCLPV